MAPRKGLDLTEQFPLSKDPFFGRVLSLPLKTQIHFWGEDTSRLHALFRYLIGESKCERQTKWLDGIDISHLGCLELIRLGVSVGSARSRVFQSLTIEEHFRIRSASVQSDKPPDYWLNRAREWFSVLRSVPRTVCGNFSGGEQQTLMLALATIGYPRIVILEEPWTGLSGEARKDVSSVFKALTDTGAIILCLSQDAPDDSHNQSDVIRLLGDHEQSAAQSTATLRNETTR
jgi:ABC-type branched-subunit amino acid transport system ATPase component